MTILQLSLYDTRDGEEEIPISQIVELWPDLEALETSGNRNTLRRNYDPDICGINAEEVEMLWDKDEEYLGAVHIAPIRPSVLTMPSKLLITYVKSVLSFVCIPRNVKLEYHLAYQFLCRSTLPGY